MMEKENIIEDLKNSLSKIKSFFFNKLERIRSNRIPIDLIKNLIINNKKIISLSELNSKANSLIINVFDKKNISPISKAILDLDLGLKIDKLQGNTIYFSQSPTTGEIRKKIINNCKKILENEVKPASREIKRKFLNKIKSLKMSINQENDIKKEVDKLLRDLDKEITKIYQNKVFELEKF